MQSIDGRLQSAASGREVGSWLETALEAVVCINDKTEKLNKRNQKKKRRHGKVDRNLKEKKRSAVVKSNNPR